ncbi:Frataxin [Cystobasidium minutum MCA 4210]|uniref:Frataxin n=1 Tax=Cystobasidium minutum MCA 4210 TaxID=1397322 RepID=UPI0034CE0708|eukprot:jgi/Rhomi1/145768/e_gw1.5.214.1
MDQLTDTLEALQEELADDDFDVEYSVSHCRQSGVLTVKLPKDKGTYVINKQPPNKQIWLSSPLSGPKRYDYSNEDQHWFYTRDGSFLLDLLEKELSDKLETKVSFEKLH